MKKTLTLIILLSGFLLNTNAQPGYLSYPKVETIYADFFSQYSMSDLTSPSLLQFQKKPDGWHVVTFRNSYDTIVKDELFWSRKTNSLEKINFTPVTDPNENKGTLTTFMQDFKNYYFDFFPYYNYPGCDWDIIQEYGGMKNLPDSLLYALGRSYSYFADNLLNNNSGFSDKRFRFKLQEKPNSLSPEQLAKYRKYHDLAIETFKAVQTINPAYKTMVGNIGIKLADEYMVGYLDMLVYQNEQEANQEIKDGVYDDFYVSIAKDYLSSCDSNAILITFGDNDTYPLQYVQAKYKFRTDVLVVNYELISVSRYINRMRSPIMGAKPLLLTLDPEKYKDMTREYIPYYNNPDLNLNPDVYSSLKFIMDFILSDSARNKVPLSDGEKINYLPEKNFKLQVNKENVKRSKILSLSENKNMEDDLEWTFKGDYLLKGQMILLDALLNNDWKRPICFTNGLDEQYMGLGNYLRVQGLVYELVPLKNPSPEPFQNPLVATGKMYSTLMHKFEWAGMDATMALDESKKQMAANIRVMVARLAGALLNENKKDSALKILDFCQSAIPEKYCNYDYGGLYIASCYYTLKEYQKANSISSDLFTIYEKKLTDYRKPGAPEIDNSSVPSLGYLKTSSSIDEAILMLGQLAGYAKNNSQDMLYNDYKQRLSALSDKGVLSKEEYDALIQ